MNLFGHGLAAHGAPWPWLGLLGCGRGAPVMQLMTWCSLNVAVAPWWLALPAGAWCHLGTVAAIASAVVVLSLLFASYWWKGRWWQCKANEIETKRFFILGTWKGTCLQSKG